MIRLGIIIVGSIWLVWMTFLAVRWVLDEMRDSNIAKRIDKWK